MARRGLQVALSVIGAVATVAGALTVFLGGASVVGAGTASATLDSELRFYAAWYVAAGILLLRVVPRVESEAMTVRLVGAAFFLAAVGRLLSWLTVGRPHPVSIALMVIEFLIPLIVIPWQTAVARDVRTGSAR